jgi:hypothetical protein
MHPITNTGATNVNQLVAKNVSFAGNDVYEYYQLAWSAYALVWNGSNASHNTPYIASLDDNTSSTLFGYVLPSALSQGTQNGQWRRASANNYVVKVDNTDVAFVYNPTDGSFACNTSDPLTGQICKRLAK